MKKIFCSFFAVLLIAEALFAVPEEAYAFSDMPDRHWAHSDVMSLAERGVISGYPDGSFRPNRTVTYGEFIKMAVCASGIAIPEAQSSRESWADKYYYAALSDGWFRGDEIQIGFMGRAVPRKHMAVILAGAAGLSPGSDLTFTDVSRGSEGASCIAACAACGLLSGYPGGTFRPDAALSRAEAATAVSRLKKHSPPDSSAVVRRVETASGTSAVRYDIVQSQLGDMGIERIEFAGGESVFIYSSIEHDFVRIMLSDGSFVPSVGFPGGTHSFENGLFVYAANPKGRDLSGTPLFLVFDDTSHKAYRFE